MAAHAVDYALFHAVNALNALDGTSFKRHGRVRGNFNKRYVKEGVFPASYTQVLMKADKLRATGDYEDFVEPTKVEVDEVIEEAGPIIAAIKAHCEGRMQNPQDQ